MSASEVTGGVEVPPRERWQFLGRERHYGFDYWIWTLAANPRPPRTLGTRWARVVEG